ncbi:hypothetical protein TWF281_002071 [Arthrobotrys megalospora]
MSLDIAIPSAAGCPPWSMLQKSYYSFCRQSFPWPAATSTRQKHDQSFEIDDQIPSNQLRPLKRIRTDRTLKPLLSSSEALEDDQLFALPPGFQVPQIKITTEESIETQHSLNCGNRTTLMHLNDVALRSETSPHSWFDRWISPREPEDQELVVSPLETPSGFLDHFSKGSFDIAMDPLGDTEMATGEGQNDELEATIPTETSSYTLVRYLADSEGSMSSQEQSISRPDFLRSTAPIDIRRELQKLESDISDAFQGMNISDDGIPEIHLQDLEASFGSENLEGLEGDDAESETGPQELPEDENDIFSLDGDEAVVVGPRGISPELESWISKSSLIVGSILKPLVGGVVDGTRSLEEDVHFHIPHGRKRKASTCQ